MTNSQGGNENAEVRQVTLPHSGAVIQFQADYDRAKLADLTRRLIYDDQLAERIRTNPTQELAEIGIYISAEDRERITDEDILTALGHRQAGVSEPSIGPAFVVVVLVAVVNAPGPAE